MESDIFVDIGLGNGLLLLGSRPLPKTMLETNINGILYQNSNIQ